MVDKNVPLNRLVLRVQKWLIEPALKGLRLILKMKNAILFAEFSKQRIKRGARARGWAPRAFELKELIQKFAFQTFCHQSRRAARDIRGGSEIRLESL